MSNVDPEIVIKKQSKVCMCVCVCVYIYVCVCSFACRLACFFVWDMLFMIGHGSSGNLPEMKQSPCEEER